MKHVTRRVTVGALSAAVVTTMVGVSTWALAGEAQGPATAAAPVRLIVGTRSGADTAAPLRTASALGAQSLAAAGPAQQAMATLGAQTLQVPGSRSAQVITALRSDPNVAYVEVDHVRKVAAVTPDDPMYTEHFQPEVDQVNLPAAWDTTTGGKVKIAVLDTGVTQDGDLTGAVISGWNLVGNNSNTTDDFGHGTTVASLIAARGDNRQGMAGACWSCVILPVKVLDKNGSGFDSDVAKGVIYATDKGAAIINMSLSGTAYSKTLSDAVAYANRKGVLVVAAAGNANNSVKNYPAALTDVVAVGATARNSDERASFSSFNKSGDSWVDMAAPGIVTGMDRAGLYHTGEPGTSFAAPMVAGAAGLIKTVHPNYTGWSMQRALLTSARSIGADNGWAKFGMLDVAKALTVETDPTPPVITGMSSPRSNSLVRGTVNVVPTGVADTWSGVRNTYLYADGVYQAQDWTTPYSLPYNSSKRNGKVVLEVRIYDKAGNKTVLQRTVTADNVLPAVKITSGPKNKAKVKGTVKLAATASDKSGVSKVELLIGGKVKSTDTTSPYAFSFKAASQPKTMKVQIRATDKAGNVKYDTARTYTR